VSLRLFDFAIVWLVVAGGSLVVRLAASCWSRPRRGVFLAAFDRMLMQLVGLALLRIGAATALPRPDQPRSQVGRQRPDVATGGNFMPAMDGTVFRQTPKSTVLSRARLPPQDPRLPDRPGVRPRIGHGARARPRLDEVSSAAIAADWSSGTASIRRSTAARVLSRPHLRAYRASNERQAAPTRPGRRIRKGDDIPIFDCCRRGRSTWFARPTT
jgi:hypothetical protein